MADPVKLQKPAPVERLSPDELAYHHVVEAQYTAALAARTSWHGYVVAKFGLVNGVDQITPDGVIVRIKDTSGGGDAGR